MQSGIAYAAGQLLAVVAPRTVLVVDAPTDWSLAGPLWELALDDAPVDEILDVLVRRGIRTAPSFAIVRVEADAVRALVRGGVPVCFERAGEPVRLDATGATTWLEGLISGARRVLVGDVETGAELPFTVSTGVVLVSGLALNCAPSTTDAQQAPGGSEVPAEPAVAGAVHASAPDDSASLSLAGASGRERRVVDLTEGESRTPAYSGAPSVEARQAWAPTPPRTGGFPRDLNGHVPSVLDPVSPANGTAQPAVPAPASFFEPRTTDDPGELADVDEPTPSPASDLLSRPATEERSGSSDFSGSSFGSGGFGSGSSFGSRPEAEDEQDEPSDSAGEGDKTPSMDFDDLLTDEAPKGPSPADLPNPESGSIAIPGLNGLNGHGPGVPPKPRPGGVPAGWPPAPDDSEPFSQFRSEAPAAPAPEQPSAPSWGAPEPAAPSAFSPAPESTPEPEQPSALGDLPLRVRGRSLRPEHQAPPAGPNSPVNGSRILGHPADQSPQGGSIFEPQAPSGQPAYGAQEDEAPSADLSQEMLPPAFFRGSRNRPEGHEEEANQPAPWQQQSGPDAWAQPQPRRGFNGGGFNGQPPAFDDGPPAMPGVLRPGAESNEDEQPEGEDVTLLAEDLPSDDDEPESAEQEVEAPREPPRLLGVWCDAGHVTSPDRSECRVCGLTVPPQAPILVARPPLGVLVFDNGDRIEVDRTVVLGRDPKPQPGSADPEPPYLHAVASSTGQVSRTHAEIRPSGWDVLLTDLGAMNGTALTLPGESPQAVEPGVPTAITPGSRVDLGGETGFVFEVEG